MRAYVRDRLSISSSDSAKTTQINTALNQERYRLNAEFRLKKTTDTLDVNADSETVTLPADVVEILSLYTSDYLLQPLTEQEFALLGTSASTGPQVYVVDGSSTTLRIRPYPTESEADALTIYYVQRPTALSSDSDTPSELPAEFHDLIAEGAIYRIAQSEEDQDLARGAAAIAAMLTDNLRAYMNRRQGATVSRVQLRGFTR